eukprot:scaffold61144_cov61-Phaeocystis_antarctica.AAC.1
MGPTQKASRGSEADSTKAMLMAQLTATVSALKRVSPLLFNENDLGTLCEAHEELGKVNDAVESQQEAVRNPPPEETPLIFDDLVHTLGFLSTKELASAALVSRHFRRSVEAVVRHRLNHLGGHFSHFELRYDYTPSVPLLARVEQWSEMEVKDAKVAVEDLKETHENVAFLYTDQLWAKLDDLRKNAKGESLRGELLSRLHRAMITEDELAKHVAYPMFELDRRVNCGKVCACHALFLMQGMPPSTIETHLDTLVWWMMLDSSIIASTALEVIQRLSFAKLASLKLKDTIASAPMATSKHRFEREKIAKLLARIPEVE